MPLVRVCAAGMASAWSWRTWRRALTTDFPLDMRILGRFLVKLGRNRFSQCGARPPDLVTVTAAQTKVACVQPSIVGLVHAKVGQIVLNCDVFKT